MASDLLISSWNPCRTSKCFFISVPRIKLMDTSRRDFRDCSKWMQVDQILKWDLSSRLPHICIPPVYLLREMTQKIVLVFAQDGQSSTAMIVLHRGQVVVEHLRSA